MWLVVRFLEEGHSGVELTQGQVIRLGRVKYLVKSLRAGPEPAETSGAETQPSDDEAMPEEVDKAEATCRVCWEKETELSNPLISHCHCSGSVRFIHLDCMKRWLSGKVAVRSNDVTTSYTWKALECDVCKTLLPLTIRHRGKTITLFDIAKPDCPHIILEAVESDKLVVKSAHVITFEGGRTQAKLGRGHESDVRINDISVSRNHAVINFTDNKFRLEDCTSKFGTLVRLAETVRLQGKVTVQLGRSLISLEEKLI
jgi:hypothetical protein